MIHNKLTKNFAKQFILMMGVLCIWMMQSIVGTNALTLMDSGNVNINAQVTQSTLIVQDVTNLQSSFSGNTITLTWDQSTASPVDSYQVYYRETSSSIYSGPIIVSSSETKASLSNVIVNTSYEFLIQTISLGTPSTGVTITQDTTIEEEPTSPAITGSGGGGGGAVTYTLFPPKINDIDAVIFEEQDDSEVLQRKCSAFHTYSHCTLLVEQNLDQGVVLYWEYPTTSRLNLDKYYIFRTTVGEPFSETPYDFVSANNTSYVDENVVFGETYLYFIKVQDVYGNISGNSNQVQVTLEAFPPESIVKSLNQYSTEALVEIPVYYSDRSGVQSIELYYSKDGGNYQLYGTIQPEAGNQQGEVIFTFDTTTTGGDGEYTFYTKAVNILGIEESIPNTYDESMIVDTVPPDSPIVTITDESTQKEYSAVLSLSPTLEEVDVLIGTSGYDDSLFEMQNLIGQWSSFSESYILYYNQPGAKNISITFRDSAGNLSETLYYTVVLDPSQKDDDKVPEFLEEPQLILESSEINELLDIFQSQEDEELFQMDSDGDGVSDGDEITYYQTDPFSAESYPKDFFFTTNIKDSDSFELGADHIYYGATLPFATLKIMVYPKSGEPYLLGETVADAFGKYSFLSKSINEFEEYSLHFVIEAGGRKFVIVRNHLSIRSSGDYFLTHGFDSIEKVNIGDIYKSEEYQKANSSEKIRILKEHAFFVHQKQVEEMYPHIKIRNIYFGQKTTGDYIRVIIAWDPRRASGRLIQLREYFLPVDQEYFTVVPPQELEAGEHRLLVIAKDALGKNSFPRELQFTIQPLYFHPSAMKEIQSAVAQVCNLFTLTDFWLWVLIAFLGGVVFTLLVRNCKESKDVNKNEKRAKKLKK